MPGNTEAILYDVNGDPLAVDDGVAIPVGTPLIISGGSDGTNSRYIKVDSSGNQILVGLGAAGTPAGGVITIQGVGGGTAVPISGTVTANAGSGNFAVVQATAALLNATVIGTVTANIGTTGGLALDATLAKLTISQGTALGSNTQALMGGSVTTVAPTYTNGNINPISLTTAGAIRVDGSAVTQPVSGTITANQGTSPWVTNVTQFGGSNVVTGTGTSGAGIPRVTISNDSSISSTERTFATFTVVGTSVIPANNKSMVSIFNADPTLIVKVHEVYVMNVRSASTTGVLGFFELRRITSHSSGTLLTSERMDTTDTLDSDVTIRTGSTVGGESTNLMWRSLFSTDEWGPGAVDTETQEHVFQTMAPIFSRKTNGTKPLTLRQNEGLTIKFATNTTTGEFDIMLVFTQE